MAFDYTNLYPDTSNNGAFTKSWNYTSVVDNLAACSVSGYFNKVATRLGIGDNIAVAQVDAFDKSRSALLDKGTLFVATISGGVVTTLPGPSTPDVNKAYVDAADALKANIASPAFTGTIHLSGVNFAINSGGYNEIYAGDGSAPAIVLGAIDPSNYYRNTSHFIQNIAGSVTYASFTGTGAALFLTPTAPTAAPGTNSTQIATTAYADAISALKAALASPAFTGTPTAPTAAALTNSTQIATTAYADALTAIRVTAEALKANLASPTFTGTPAAPTAAVDTNTTQLATTAMVIGQAASATPLIDGAAAVGTSTRFARGDHVHPTDTTRQAADAQLFSNIPQNSKSAAYTTVLTDGEKHIFHPSADTTARTFTIDSNANVAYPIGTVITFINQNAAGVVTIAITTDTLRMAGPGSTGSRTLAANGIASAIKVTTTEWIISGTGLS